MTARRSAAPNTEYPNTEEPEDGSGEFDPPLEWCRGRRGTKWARPGGDVLPAWVADMDYRPCPAVAEAITALVERGDLGYPDWDSPPLAEPFSERMERLYGWRPDPAHVRQVSDLIQAMQVTTELCTERRQPVVAQLPNYPPFLGSLEEMGRPLVALPMREDGPSWSFDPDELDAAVRRSGARLLLLVNPHNPTGRVLRRDELEQLADVACRHDMVVLSDEIHAELLHEGHHHIPIASLGEEVAARTVTITSASKAFNLAGLRVGLAHVGAERVRRAWDELPEHLLGSPSVVGVEATLAAWASGDGWLARLRRHLTAQRDHLGARLSDLPGVSFRPPEGTYLAWLDCRASAAATDDPAAWFKERAGVELSPGPAFGEGGRGHARLNFATSRAILDEILDRMAAGLRGSAGSSG